MNATKDDGPDWAEDLGEHREKFEQLRREPKKLLVALRSDIEFQIAVTKADTRPFLRRWFAERDGGWVCNLEGTGPVGPASVGSEWSFAGAHTVDGAFNGLAASGKDVVVRGYTIMSAEPVDKGDGTDFKVRRYVDWAGLYGQLGLSINWRVPVAAPPRER